MGALNYYGSNAPKFKQCSMDRLGVYSIAVTQQVPAPKESVLSVVGQYLKKSAAPDIGVNIPCITINTPKFDNGNIIFEWGYEGFDGVPGDSEVLCEIDGSDSEEPVETNPNFLVFASKYGAVYDDTGQFSYFPTQAPAGVQGNQLADGRIVNPLAGMTRYNTGGYVWRRRYLSLVLNQDMFTKAFFIDTPQGAPGQNVPDLGSQRNWLKLAPQGRWRGNCYEIVESWLASGPYGWNSDVYGAPAQ